MSRFKTPVLRCVEINVNQSINKGRPPIPQFSGFRTVYYKRIKLIYFIFPKLCQISQPRGPNIQALFSPKITV